MQLATLKPLKWIILPYAKTVTCRIIKAFLLKIIIIIIDFVARSVHYTIIRNTTLNNPWTNVDCRKAKRTRPKCVYV